MIKTYWRKPYVRVEEKDYGSIRWAIVTYEKRVTRFVTRDRGPHPLGRIEGVPVECKHWLQVDLWLVVLEFVWTTGDHIHD